MQRKSTNNNVLLVLVIAVFVAVTAVLLVFAMKPQNKKETENASSKQEQTEMQQKNKPESTDDVVIDEPVEIKENRVSFVAVGDNIVHDSILADAKKHAELEGVGDEYNFLPFYENVSDYIQNADIAFINFEAPVAGRERRYSGYPNFNTPEKAAYDLKELGFDVFNIANNHMLDRGEAGYQSSVDFWKQQEDILYIGGFENEDDYNDIRIIEENGIKIAFLSYTYGTNGINLPSGSQMVVPLCDDDEIDRQTKLAREMADAVVVSIHWGQEDYFEPTQTQKKQMEIMVNNNVDVIIGTHPHVLEQMTFVDRPDGKKTLVMYSLGNFFSGMLYARNMVGGIAGFDIVKTDDGTFVENPSFVPTMCHYEATGNNRYNFKLYKLSDYTPELFNTHGTQTVSDRGRSFEYLQNIVDGAIPVEFLERYELSED